MALTSSRLAAAVTRKARSRIGARFGRFAVAAGCALAANEIALVICLEVKVNAGTGAFFGWLAGSIVSYFMSRWAFASKGKPRLLKETIPFWIVSAMVMLVLILATKLGSHTADWLGLTGASRKLFVVGANLAANCLTFVARFVFFHYVLFAERGSAAAAVSDASGTPEETFVVAEAEFEEREFAEAEFAEAEFEERDESLRSRHQVP